MESLNANEQRQFAEIAERKQMKDFMTMYSNLVQRCFEHCVNDFTTKAVSSKEQTCVNNCAQKFIKGSERLGQRFAELNAQMSGAAPPGM